jgi:hypothetical protein
MCGWRASKIEVKLATFIVQELHGVMCLKLAEKGYVCWLHIVCMLTNVLKAYLGGICYSKTMPIHLNYFTGMLALGLYDRAL